MATTAVIAGLSSSSTGKRLLSSSSYYSDHVSVFNNDNVIITITNGNASSYYYSCYHHQLSWSKNHNLIVSAAARKPSNNYTTRSQQSIRALPLGDHAHVDHDAAKTAWFVHHDACSSSVDALLLLQKSMLEKQWNLSLDTKPVSLSPDLPTHATTSTATSSKKIPVASSGVSARHRRISARNKALSNNNAGTTRRPVISPELLNNRFKGYVKGIVADDLLTHAQVVRLSNKIKIGLSLEQHKSRYMRVSETSSFFFFSPLQCLMCYLLIHEILFLLCHHWHSRLKERLGCEPSDEQLATSLRISRAELHSKLIESCLAREKLAMSNVRLVMSIAQRYDNMGAEMADLIQVLFPVPLN